MAARCFFSTSESGPSPLAAFRRGPWGQSKRGATWRTFTSASASAYGSKAVAAAAVAMAAAAFAGHPQVVAASTLPRGFPFSEEDIQSSLPEFSWDPEPRNEHAKGPNEPSGGTAGDTSSDPWPPKDLYVPSVKASRVAEDAPSSPLQLLQVHVLFRHGDRSPMPLEEPSKEDAARWETRLQPRPSPDVLPPRQHTRGLEWPFGQLTTKGARQAQNLGSILRKRYAAALGLALPSEAQLFKVEGSDEASVLALEQSLAASGSFPSSFTFSGSSSPTAPPNPPPKPFNASERRGHAEADTSIRSQLVVRSTNFPRTYQSAFFVLKGLLGSEAAASLIPIAIRGDKEENLYENDHCARGVMLWGRAWKERTAPVADADGALRDIGWRAKYQDAKSALISFFDINKENRFPWTLATDNAACMAFHGDKLPPPLSEARINEIRDHISQDYAKVFSVREVARLAMGPLIWELQTAMDKCIRAARRAPSAVKAPSSEMHSPGAAAQAPPVGPPKLLLYSGHDATIMPLAAALGVAPEAWPPYSSWMAFELWSTQDHSQQFVRVLYNGQEVALPTSTPPRVGSASWHDLGPWRRQPGNSQAATVLCPWDNFCELTAWAKMSPEEYFSECKGAHSSL